jgi:hypothetical protein
MPSVTAYDRITISSDPLITLGTVSALIFRMEPHQLNQNYIIVTFQMRKKELLRAQIMNQIAQVVLFM